jgi:acetyltransferase, GNAT family
MQWSGGYPSEEIVRRDIADHVSWVLENECGHLYAVFALIPGDDPTYAYIEGGAWRDTSPYATIHRAAGDGTVRSVFRTLLDFARMRYDHLRADTHADNIPMQNAFLKNGFAYCGIIYLASGDPRRAYEWTKENTDD